MSVPDENFECMKVKAKVGYVRMLQDGTCPPPLSPPLSPPTPSLSVVVAAVVVVVVMTISLYDRTQLHEWR